MMKAGNAPRHIRIRAGHVLKLWQQGFVKPRRSCRPGHLSIGVTPAWRLYSADGGENWTVLSQADFFKVIGRD